MSDYIPYSSIFRINSVQGILYDVNTRAGYSKDSLLKKNNDWKGIQNNAWYIVNIHPHFIMQLWIVAQLLVVS